MPNAKLFEQPNLLIGNAGLFSIETDPPICSALASKALKNIQKKELRYRIKDKYIFADWEKPEFEVNNLEQRKFYIGAYAELPNLVLRHMRRLNITSKIGSPGKAQEELICRQLLFTYKIQTQWLEVYLLENESLLPELKKDARKHLKSMGFLSQCLYSLIQQMRITASETEDRRYQWILHFDSPAQAWFSYEAFLCLVHMTRKLTPGDEHAKVSKEEYRKSVCDLVNTFFNNGCDSLSIYKKEKNSTEFRGLPEVGYINAIDAVDSTAKEMIFHSKKAEINNSYGAYLKAWRAEANYRRKNEEIQSSRTTESGNVIW